MTSNTKSTNIKDKGNMKSKNKKEQHWYVLPEMSDLFHKNKHIIEYYLHNNDRISNRPLLIIGESGVGKSLFIEVARQIATKTGTGKYIRVNCASFEKNLADSELFGHNKGAFTDAKTDKKGIVEEADGGLLVLDEIGELSDEVQAKLLIFIEEGIYRPVGGNYTSGVNIKIIGTTNKQQDKFRPDFWYRFYPIFLPAFYERRLDVLYYIALMYKDVFTRLTPSHTLNLLVHNWPGNAREIDRIMSYIIYEDMFHYNSTSTDISSSDSHPLFLPTDQRQTTLVSPEVRSLCKSMIDSGFTMHLFNALIGEYGLSMPYSYTDSRFVQGFIQDIVSLMSQDNILLKTIIQEIVPDLKVENFVQLVNINDTATSTESLSAKKSGYFVEFVQKFVDHYNKFYRTIFDEEPLILTEAASLDNIYLCQKHSKIEQVGDCFSAICKLFLRNQSSESNVFDFTKRHETSFSRESKLQEKILSDLCDAGQVGSAMGFVFGVQINVPRKINKNESWQDFVTLIVNKNKEKINNTSEDDSFASDKNRLFEQDEYSLLKEYYKYVTAQYDTIEAASKHVGCKANSLGEKLVTMGLKRKRKYRKQNKQ